MELKKILSLAYVEAFRRWSNAYAEMDKLPKNEVTLEKVREAYDDMVEIHEMMIKAKQENK